MGLLLSIIGNAIALFATTVVPGITFNGNWVNLLIGGAIFGLFNLIVRPIATLLSLPFLVLTLGLFYFVLNGILLWVAANFIPGYHVDGIVGECSGQHRDRHRELARARHLRRRQKRLAIGEPTRLACGGAGQPDPPRSELKAAGSGSTKGDARGRRRGRSGSALPAPVAAPPST